MDPLGVEEVSSKGGINRGCSQHLLLYQWSLTAVLPQRGFYLDCKVFHKKIRKGHLGRDAGPLADTSYPVELVE